MIKLESSSDRQVGQVVQPVPKPKLLKLEAYCNLDQILQITRVHCSSTSPDDTML
jgi:hypothetical protein